MVSLGWQNLCGCKLSEIPSSVLSANATVAFSWDHCGLQERDTVSPQCERDSLGTHRWLSLNFFYGAQATSPYPPCGDHTTTSSNIKPGVLDVYEAFVPLWKLLKHKRWVLLPAAVVVNDSHVAAANIFSIKHGLAIPILNVPEWGHHDSPNATVTISVGLSALQNCSLTTTDTPDRVQLLS